MACRLKPIEELIIRGSSKMLFHYFLSLTCCRFAEPLICVIDVSTKAELPDQTIHALLTEQEQGGRRLLAFAASRGSLAGLVLILSILNLASAVLDTLHQRLPGLGFMCVILCIALCGARFGYGVYREAVRTAVEMICGARASALVRLNSRTRRAAG
jgi:hypothetical protein